MSRFSPPFPAALVFSVWLAASCGGTPVPSLDPMLSPPTPSLVPPTVPQIGPPPMAAVDPTGTWSQSGEIAMVVDSKKACEADQGEWREDRGCLFPMVNTVVFGAKATVGGVDTWPVKVETIGDNAHTCVFEGTARRDGDRWLAVEPAETYEGAEPKKEDCRVEFKFGPSGLDVDALDTSCQYFCGVRAQIFLRGAQKG